MSELEHRFKVEYLEDLKRFHAKGTRSTRPIQLKEIVLIDGLCKSRVVWETGLVTKLCPGADGKVRSVELRTQDGALITRPIQRLYPLEVIGHETSNREPGEAAEPNEEPEQEPESDEEIGGEGASARGQGEEESTREGEEPSAETGGGEEPPAEPVEQPAIYLQVQETRSGRRTRPNPRYAASPGV